MLNKSFLKYLKNPIFWVSLLMISFNVIHSMKDDALKSVIYSDGSGYYAYLPSILLYNDNTFEKSIHAENKYKGQESNQIFAFKDRKGNVANKYFPGIAILQLPFFCLACFFSWLFGQPVTGYSDLFSFFYLLGSTFYSVIGLVLFERFYRYLFPSQEKSLKWIIPVFLIATPLMFYCLQTSYTHNFSFFLFGLFAFQIIKLKTRMNKKNFFFLGVILSLIVLVRPTNLIVLLIIPFILGSKDSFLNFLKTFFIDKGKYFFLSLIGFSSLFSILFLIWKWESGDWIIWSYSGEGFNFLSPKIFECLFGFRIGLFLQIPLMIIAVLGSIVLFKKNSFRFLIWAVYFAVSIWIFSSWWCWDFDSSFGSRAYTEHLVFLLIPIVYLFEKYKRIAITAMLFFLFIGLIRISEVYSGFMHNQRFTKENYIESLFFWKKENDGMWNYTKACQPFGEKINETELLNEPNLKRFTKLDEFVYAVETKLKRPRTNERYFYKVNLDKKIETEYLENTYLVIDLWNKDNSKRLYQTVDLFNDKYEGKNQWAKLSFEGELLDNYQEYDFIKMYLWNQGRNEFSIKNVSFSLEEYKSQ